MPFSPQLSLRAAILPHATSQQALCAAAALAAAFLEQIFEFSRHIIIDYFDAVPREKSMRAEATACHICTI